MESVKILVFFFLNDAFVSFFPFWLLPFLRSH